MKHSSEKLLQLIINEYPFLDNTGLQIKKQFKTFGNNLSNTFLVTSEKKGFEEFIAKGHGAQEYQLENEWLALQLIQNNVVPSPKLLLPDHEPNQLLLTQYMESKSGDIYSEEGSRGELFYQIGRTIGTLHDIQLPQIGRLNEGYKDDWIQYLEMKFSKHINNLKNIVDSSLFESTINLITKLMPVATTDNKKPVFLHRDVYLHNFLFKTNDKTAYLIDYAKTIGGRPLLDIAKFFIIDMYDNAEYISNFIAGYTEFQRLPDNYFDLMRLYLLRESMSIIVYAHEIGDTGFKKRGEQILKELSENKGTIIEIIS